MVAWQWVLGSIPNHAQPDGSASTFFLFEPSSVLHTDFCGCLRNARPFRVFVARRFLHVWEGEGQWAELQMPRGIRTQA